jgi:hypothetical protein
MIDGNDYFIVQKSDGSYYKMKIQTLDNLYISIAENINVDNLFSKIESLSVELLELSANILENYSTIENISKRFELISDVQAMAADDKILTENQILDYVKSNDYATLTKTEEEYYKENDKAYEIFDEVVKTIDGWV